VTKALTSLVYSAESDGLTDATYLGLAANEYRADISAVPGSGSILGLCQYGSKLYAWRNNAGGTAKDMYYSSTSGWVKVTFGEELKFTNANASVNEGDTVTQGGVTALVKRVIVRSGTLASGTNEGSLIITGRSGGNFVAGAGTSTGAGALTISGAQLAITMQPGGRVNAVVANFGAGPQNKNMYLADGVSTAFEFDGTNLTPIRTGMADDTPDLIAVHKQHLFLTFGYSLQFSGLGTPFVWTPILGAGEIAMNADISNVIILPGDQTGGALGVYTRSEMQILYGTGASSFALASFNTGSGAVAYTAQNIDQTYFLNEQGVSSLSTTRDYGNFSPSALTMNIRPFVQAHLPYTVASGLSRERGQYRVFFSDGFGLYLTIRSGKFIGAMPVQFPNPVTCVEEGESSDGRKTSYFGSTNGMVYEMDVGSSFDGEDIAANINLVFNGTGNHRVTKRYRKASIEATGSSYAQFRMGYDTGYRSEQYEQANDVDYSNDLRSAYWDEFYWDNFVWDGREVSPTEADMTGTAENVAFRISSVSSVVKPFTINSITIHYTQRRGLR